MRKSLLLATLGLVLSTSAFANAPAKSDANPANAPVATATENKEAAQPVNADKNGKKQADEKKDDAAAKQKQASKNHQTIAKNSSSSTEIAQQETNDLMELDESDAT